MKILPPVKVKMKAYFNSSKGKSSKQLFKRKVKETKSSGATKGGITLLEIITKRNAEREKQKEYNSDKHCNKNKAGKEFQSSKTPVKEFTYSGGCGGSKKTQKQLRRDTKEKDHNDSPTDVNESDDYSSDKNGSKKSRISNRKLQRIILKRLVVIENKIDALGNKYEPSDSAFHLQQITSLEELEEFQQQLADSVDMQNQVIERLKKVGGSNIGDHVRNIVKK